MGTIKILGFDEDGNAQRLKIRIARFLDYDPVTASDKSNIRSTLGITSQGGLGDLLAANNLDDVASLDTTKANLEIPDVGTAPDETPLNQHLGSLAYQSADSVSVAELEVESTTGTATTQALTVTDGTDTNFVVQEDGKTGIGTASPSAKIHSEDTVTDNSSAEVARIQGTSSAGGTNTSLRFTAASSASNADNRWFGIQAYDHNPTARALALQHNGGNVGIGTTSPSATVEVTDDTTNVAAVRVTRRSDLASTYLEMGTTGGSAEVRSTDNLVLSADLDNNGTGSAIQFKVDGSEKWSINSTGNLVAGANLGIDLGSGSTLNDYEEGEHQTTATPGVSGSITLSSTHDTFAYTKIGRSIIVTGFLQVDSVSSPTGPSLYFTLPTSTLNLGDNGGSFGSSVAYYDNSSGAWSVMPCSAGESTNNLFVNIDASTVAANDQFRVMVCYQSA